MKKRVPSDPLSWFFQAAIHGVKPEVIAAAAKNDPKVEEIFQKRYWNQCPHNGEESANFLPWHRAYTHYFERILRMHTEDSQFALPYWNYTDPDATKRENRKFPKAFGIEHLDGKLDNNEENNINPLYLAERDFYFCGYEHPFAQGLPLLELSDGAVDIRLPMASEVFFGNTEREGLGGAVADESTATRGLLESYPHDHIHRAVGGIVGEAVGAMASPPTAGFDPIFPIHHSNIDWLWARWSLMPGKKWGKFPSAYWFNERPWFFYDVDGKVVNEPRKAYFDYRALGIRFKYEDLNIEPLRLPADVGEERPSPQPLIQLGRQEEVIRRNQARLKVLASVGPSFAAVNSRRSVMTISAPAKQHFRPRVQALRAVPAADGATRQRMAVRLKGVRLGLVRATGFDVHVTNTPEAALDRNSPSFVGSIALFTHGPEKSGEHSEKSGAHHGDHGQHDESAEFDVTNAVAEGGDLQRLSVVLVPYALLTVPGRDTVFLDDKTLDISGIELLASD